MPIAKQRGLEEHRIPRVKPLTNQPRQDWTICNRGSKGIHICKGWVTGYQTQRVFSYLELCLQFTTARNQAVNCPCISLPWVVWMNGDGMKKSPNHSNQSRLDKPLVHFHLPFPRRFWGRSGLVAPACCSPVDSLQINTLQTNFQDLPGSSRALARFLMAVMGILTVCQRNFRKQTKSRIPRTWD